VAVGGCDSAEQLSRRLRLEVTPTARRANQKPGKAARLICLVKDINFIDVNRQTTYKHSHLRYAMLATGTST